MRRVGSIHRSPTHYRHLSDPGGARDSRGARPVPAFTQPRVFPAIPTTPLVVDGFRSDAGPGDGATKTVRRDSRAVRRLSSTLMHNSLLPLVQRQRFLQPLRAHVLPACLLLPMLVVVLAGAVHPNRGSAGTNSAASAGSGLTQQQAQPPQLDSASAHPGQVEVSGVGSVTAASGQGAGSGSGGQPSGPTGISGQGALVPQQGESSQQGNAVQSASAALPSCPWSIPIGPWSPISLDPCKMAIQILLGAITWGARMFVDSAIVLLSPLISDLPAPAQQAAQQGVGPGVGSVLATGATDGSNGRTLAGVSAVDGSVDPASCADTRVNILLSTPHALTDCNSAVQLLFVYVEYVAWAGLALIIVVGGFNLMIRPHLGITYHEFVEFLPRLIMGALGIVLSLWFARALISFCNALDQTSQAALSFQLWANLPDLIRNPAADALLYEIFAVAYFILIVLTILQMLVRLALLDLCIIMAPLGMACWILPQTQRWGSLWCSAFVSTLIVQPLQLFAISLAGHLMTWFPSNGRLIGTVLQLAIGCACFYVAWRLPRFLDNFATRIGVGMVGWREVGGMLIEGFETVGAAVALVA